MAVRESLSFTFPNLSEQTSVQSICSATPFPPWAASVPLDKQRPIDNPTDSQLPVKGEQQPSSQSIALSQSLDNSSGSLSSDTIRSETSQIQLPTQLGLGLQVDTNKRNVIVGITPNNHFAFRIRAEPLPGYGEDLQSKRLVTRSFKNIRIPSCLSELLGLMSFASFFVLVVEWLDENANELQVALSHQTLRSSSSSMTDSTISEKGISPFQLLKKEICDLWSRSWTDQSLYDHMNKHQMRHRRLRAPKDSFGQSQCKQPPGDLLGISITRGSRNLLFWSVDPTENQTAGNLIKCYTLLYTNIVSILFALAICTVYRNPTTFLTVSCQTPNRRVLFLPLCNGFFLQFWLALNLHRRQDLFVKSP